MPHGHTSSEREGQGDIIVVTVAQEEKQPMQRNFRGGLQTLKSYNPNNLYY